ncbi:trafficking protein particle complex subunit 2-like protein [Oryctolagus cuniculus]|uniref:trafficking protein particle complex subunit 2-like protein n=1 Tax=Oryctolagus cuniculus TaxID=9986 RepID=UPI003879832C
MDFLVPSLVDESVDSTVAKKNYPLIFSTPRQHTEIRLGGIHISGHTDEKISTLEKTLVVHGEFYLRFVFSVEDYKVNGYDLEKLHFRVDHKVLVSSKKAHKDNEFHCMFWKMHNSYIDVLYNSIYNLEGPSPF